MKKYRCLIFDFDMTLFDTSRGSSLCYEKAFESIPHIECNMAEDFLISFFTTFYAEKYVGIENLVYQYRAQSGMSSKRKIDSLKKIRMVCSE